jgi:hypothetical protein
MASVNLIKYAFYYHHVIYMLGIHCMELNNPPDVCIFGPKVYGNAYRSVSEDLLSPLWSPSSVFGSQLDIHSGGIDLAFPHHENEIAQCEAYHQCGQWGNYFLHSGRTQ